MPFLASGMLRFGQIAGGHDQMGFWNALYVSSAPYWFLVPLCRVLAPDKLEKECGHGYGVHRWLHNETFERHLFWTTCRQRTYIFFRIEKGCPKMVRKKVPNFKTKLSPKKVTWRSQSTWKTNAARQPKHTPVLQRASLLPRARRLWSWISDNQCSCGCLRPSAASAFESFIFSDLICPKPFCSAHVAGFRLSP